MRIWLLLIALSAVVVAGCGQSSADAVQPVNAEVPESWTADGKTWTHQTSINKSDEEVLMKFFQIHTSFQGSTDFEGSPQILVTGKSDRRFYWFRGTPDALAWSCIHFEGGRFLTSEGTGSPFVK
jgi:opacity protein-like surface antigen